MTAADSPIINTAALPAKTWPPPGGWMAAPGVAVLVMAEVASRLPFPFFAIGAVAGLILSFSWLFCIVPTLVHRRLRLRRAEWLRWLSTLPGRKHRSAMISTSSS